MSEITNQISILTEDLGGTFVYPDNASAEPAGKAVAEHRASRDACVMIIDDEKLNIEVVKEYLKEVGFENFLSTTHAPNAVEMLRNHQPDIVLLEVYEPFIPHLLKSD